MTVTQLGGQQGNRRAARTPRCASTSTPVAGDANIKSITVTLPNAFEIDQNHLGNLCSES